MSLEPDRALELFLLAREALSNTSRHAQATAVSVTLHEADGEITLLIHDDGIGFDSASPSPDGHFGLRTCAPVPMRLGPHWDSRAGAGWGRRSESGCP